MTDFHEQDLTGSTFRRVSLRGAELTEVYLNDARLRMVDLSGLQVRASYLQGVRMRGVEMVDVDISGELRHVVVNGVDVAPLVEAELDRRMPDRVLMRPDDVPGFRTGWATLGRLWDGTLERARSLPEASLHHGEGDEWSFVQVLRHLNFVAGTWVCGLVLRDPSPWHPLDLPWDEAPQWEGVPRDRDARPALEDVLAVRRERHALVAGVLEGLTPERLNVELTSTEPGWPEVESSSVGDALRVLLREEWEHRLQAERALASVGEG